MLRHECCNRKCPARLPTRLIDVESSLSHEKLRLHHTTQGQTAQYVALSYCWGKNQSVLTTSHNVKEYSTGFALDTLHRTVRDAVTVTRKLGVRYLWVDALCILQDDPADKAKEISAMGDIYRNAYITIVASRARNVDEGFLNPSLSYHNVDEPDKRFRFPYRCLNGEMGEVWVEQYFGESHSVPLSERAWAMQELVLSTRALIYEPSVGVQWSCMYNGRYSANGLRELLAADVTPANDSANKHPSRDEIALRSEAWEGLISTYSSRNLSLPGDKFFAIEGIARQLNKTWEDTYLAGLWRSNFMRQLAWHINFSFTWGEDHQKIYTVRPPLPEYRAPSWSWASTDERIDFKPRLCKYFFDHAELVDYTITPVTPENPVGQLRHAAISLRAPSISCEDVILDDPSWKWTLMLDDDYSNKLDASRSSVALYVFLGYIYWHTKRDHRSGSDEIEREAMGLILIPVAGKDTFRRIGMFVIAEPQEYKFYSDIFPAKPGVKAQTRTFNII